MKKSAILSTQIVAMWVHNWVNRHFSMRLNGTIQKWCGFNNTNENNTHGMFLDSNVWCYEIVVFTQQLHGQIHLLACSQPQRAEFIHHYTMENHSNFFIKTSNFELLSNHCDEHNCKAHRNLTVDSSKQQLKR